MATAWREQVISNPAVMHGQACIKGTALGYGAAPATDELLPLPDEGSGSSSTRT